MVRKLVVFFTSVVLFTAAHAKALGLGEIVLDSALNQPLNAQIALLQLGDVRPDQISVQIADESDFARFSIERETFLNSIRFNVQSQGANTFVQLSTVDAVREPYLSFVLETRWPSGRLLSEHTVLLDLPAFAPAGNAAPVQQPTQTRENTPQNNQNQIVTNEQSSASLGQQARFAAPAEPEESPVAVADAVPADEPVSAAPAAAPEPTPIPAPAPAPAPNAPSRLASVDETVTIGSADTLWDIALQVRPDSSVSVQQTMLALQSLNREAFISDNINMVRRGQVLRVPTLEQIRNLTVREAMSEVARQNQQFANRRNAPLAAQPITAQPQSSTTTAPNQGELSVVSVDSDQSSDASADSGAQSAQLEARIASLEDALAVQREEADRAARVNAELTARLGLLEEQIDSAQEIIRLRDLELAQLQQALEEAAAAQPAPVDPPTVITMAPQKTFVQQIIDTLVANTYALIALIGLVILMLVFVLLRRNRAADEAALAGIDGMEAEEEENATEFEQTDEEDYEIPEVDSEMNSDSSASELDEILDIAGSADAAILSEGYDFDDDEDPEGQTEIHDGVDEFDESEGEYAEDEEVDADVLEEVEALVAYGRIDDAQTMLEDAIDAEPDRADLRMKLLELLAARQDIQGFEQQEAVLRDMEVPGLEPRIALLSAQLLTESDDSDADEDDYFDELNVLDDEVDEDEDDRADIEFNFTPDEEGDDESSIESAANADEDERGMDLSFSSPEPGALIEDFDEADLEANESSSDLELAQSVEETISFEPVEMPPATEADAAEVELEIDENAIDFDFDFAVDEPSNDVSAEKEASVDDATHDDETDPDHEVDFDFAVIDDEAPSNESGDASKAPESIEEIKFEIEGTEEVEIEFLDDDDESAGIDFSFDDSSFDIEDEPSEEPESKTEPVKADDDTVDDLEFAGDAEDDDFDFLSDDDEAATKLDLARAYFEMGDHEGAREILEEVQKEGNEEQVKDATELLSKL